MRRLSHLLDAFSWLFLSALVLSLLPIGHVSADGIGQSLSLSAGFVRWNPNHLLVEPIGAWWQGLLAPSSSRAEAVDHLRLLSVFAGSLAVGLFRLGVASRLASSRLAANHATLWLAASSAFARLWVLDEIYMLQMPAVVAVALFTLRYLERPSLLRAATAGASVTLAAAFFISNLLLGPALAVALRRKRRDAAALLTGNLATAGALFAGIWALSRTPHGFVEWLIRYGGGTQLPRVEAAYGLQPTLAGFVESASRALYGSACALVDLAPAVAAFRDGLPVGPEIVCGLLAFAAAVLALLLSRPDSRAALLFTAWTMAVLGFGVFWNNSDDQFYVPLSVGFAALAARMPPRRAVVALGLAALLWNVVDIAQRRVFYPRQERLALIEKELGGAGLVVYPGFDEMEVLLQLEAGPPTVSMTGTATRLPFEAGMDSLAKEIGETLAKGRPVALVDILDAPPNRSPWKFLRRMGYEHARVVEILRRFPVDPARRMGPFSVRWIRPDKSSASSHRTAARPSAAAVRPRPAGRPGSSAR